MRSFKPALARDYDVFFAAIGLLCGGILFFQGWRLDPILQFGQFLLAGTTVFFGYESVRLRGITADAARRSSFFDDEPSPSRMPGRGREPNWDESFDPYERFDEPPEIRRRFSGEEPIRPDSDQEDSYRRRRTTRAAIPEEAASRIRPNRRANEDWRQNNETERRMGRFNRNEDEIDKAPRFGERRSLRQDQRSGSRPTPSTRRNPSKPSEDRENLSANRSRFSSSRTKEISNKSRTNLQEPQDAAYTPKGTNTPNPRNSQKRDAFQQRSAGSYSQKPSSKSNPRDRKPRDNSSRFDD